MQLLIDIGNTRTKYIYLHDLNRIAVSSVDNTELSYNSLESLFAQATDIVFASVQQELAKLLIMWAREQKINCLQVETQHQAFNVNCGYPKPEQLGIDRWLAIIGAATLYPQQNVLIVDSGTATTYDLLDNTGQHQGGWIVPGIELMRDSLNRQTSRINISAQLPTGQPFGSDTQSNVNQGCWSLTYGGITFAIDQAQKLGMNLDKIVLTGGNAEALLCFANNDYLIEKQLVFVGLARFFNQS